MSRERDGSEERNSNNNDKSSRHYEYIVKLTGISSSSNKDDIKKFLSPCRIINILLFDSSAGSTSECFVVLDSDIDLKDALKKSGSNLDKKYVEIFQATNYEYKFNVKHNGKVSWHEPVIRLSGLPSNCTMADVQKFFENVDIARNGIYITRDMADKALGDGFVAFINMDDAYKAIDVYDQKRIQHRYIELFPSSYEDAKKRIMNDARLNAKHFVGEDDDDNIQQNNTDYDNNNNTNGNTNNNNYTRRVSRSRTRSRTRSRSRQRSRSRSNSRDYRQRETRRRYSPAVSPPRSRPPPRSANHRSYNSVRQRSRSRSPIRHSSSRTDEHLVKIRGMPYTVVEEDVRKFFPSTCQPTRIEIIQDRRMKRPNGDGNLYFATLDQVTEAMAYDRKYMGNRYVELYFDSPRYASLNIRKKKSDDPPRRPSQSPPPKPRNSRYSRSRSESMD